MKANEKLTYVCLYADYLSSFAVLSDAAVGRLTKALLIYLTTGEEISIKGNEKVLWPSLRNQLERDIKSYEERCERNRLNGAKGGKQKQLNRMAALMEEAEASGGYPLLANLAKEKEKEKENEKKKEKENEKKKENEKNTERDTGIAAAPSRPRFSKPTAADIQAYCREKGYCVDPEAIWDYYEANGWMVGRSPMKDWKAAVRNWMRKENEHGRSKKSAAPKAVVFKCGHSL